MSKSENMFHMKFINNYNLFTIKIWEKVLRRKQKREIVGSANYWEEMLKRTSVIEMFSNLLSLFLVSTIAFDIPGIYIKIALFFCFGLISFWTIFTHELTKLKIESRNNQTLVMMDKLLFYKPIVLGFCFGISAFILSGIIIY